MLIHVRDIDYEGFHQSICFEIYMYLNSFKPLRIAGEFWDFLFSDSWQDGYSVRVLEGQLMGLLVTKLVKLTKVGQVTQHSTVAYAKNTRHHKAVYKHSKVKTFSFILLCL